MINKAIPAIAAAGILGLGTHPAVNGPAVNAPAASQGSASSATNSPTSQPPRRTFGGFGLFGGQRNDARSLPADPPDVPAPKTDPQKPDPNPGKAGK